MLNERDEYMISSTGGTPTLRRARFLSPTATARPLSQAPLAYAEAPMAAPSVFQRLEGAAQEVEAVG